MLNELKRLIAKGLRKIFQPPALTNCRLDRTSKICSGSQINNTAIGRYSYVGHDCFFVNVMVGAFCSIADDCHIGGAAHPIARVSTSPVFHEGANILGVNFANFNPVKTPLTIIKNDVWIGANACIKAGVTIENGAVVGMGAIVTHNIGPYEIWAGNPARMLRKRFDEETIIKLLKSNWWDFPNEKLKKAGMSFYSPEDLFIFLRSSNTGE